MKPVTIALVATLAAFSAAADEVKPAVQNTAQSNVQHDSPLVAAAKKSAKTKKKKASTVITNDTLLKSGGHVTSTTVQNPLPPVTLGPPEEEQLAAKRREEAKVRYLTEEARKKQELHETAVARHNAMSEGDYDNVAPAADPKNPNLTAEERAQIEKELTAEEKALLEKMAQEETKKPPL
jgi:hypothetical protein